MAPASCPGPDLQSAPLQNLKWDPADVPGSAAAVHQKLRAHALHTISWYQRAKQKQGRWCRGLKFFAVVFVALGGLAPILQGSGLSGVLRGLGPIADINIIHLGYLCAGLAGALIGLDKAFGFSTSYMRYVTAAMDLQRLVAEFDMDWLILCSGQGGASPEQQLARLKTFQTAIYDRVNSETQAWLTEFQTSMTDLGKAIQKAEESLKSSSIDLSVPDGDKVKGDITVLLDGVVNGRLRGTRWEMLASPGQHLVGIQIQADGATLTASASVIVTSGVKAPVTLPVPKPETKTSAIVPGTPASTPAAKPGGSS